MNGEVDVVTFDEFAAMRGLSMAQIGEAGTHKRGRNQSDKQWKRLLRVVDHRSAEVVEKRSALRAEYNEAVARGDIRPPTRLERLQRAASGHPDLASTQAALRILSRLTGAA